jgi:hypothetical protein
LDLQLTRRYTQINELSRKVVNLIPKDDFEFIQSVDIASMHIQSTKLDLERIRATTEGIVEVAELLNVSALSVLSIIFIFSIFGFAKLQDPENLLLVYEKLKKLKTARDACQEGLELGRLSVNDQIELGRP